MVKKNVKVRANWKLEVRPTTLILVSKSTLVGSSSFQVGITFQSESLPEKYYTAWSKVHMVHSSHGP